MFYIFSIFLYSLLHSKHFLERGLLYLLPFKEDPFQKGGRLRTVFVFVQHLNLGFCVSKIYLHVSYYSGIFLLLTVPNGGSCVSRVLSTLRALAAGCFRVLFLFIALYGIV